MAHDESFPALASGGAVSPQDFEQLVSARRAAAGGAPSGGASGSGDHPAAQLARAALGVASMEESRDQGALGLAADARHLPILCALEDARAAMLAHHHDATGVSPARRHPPTTRRAPCAAWAARTLGPRPPRGYCRSIHFGAMAAD